MANRNPVLRSVNELSLAAWFGGSLMGAVGLPRASAVGGSELDAEAAGWSVWQPVQAVAIAAQVASGAGLTAANRGRYLAQRGVASTSAARTGLTVGAVVATALAARRGRQLQERSMGPGPDEDELRSLRRRTRFWQCLVPTLTGGIIVLDAVMGEQQRPQQVLGGVLDRLVPGR